MRTDEHRKNSNIDEILKKLLHFEPMIIMRMVARFDSTLETGLRIKYQDVLNRSRHLTTGKPDLNRANSSFEGRLLTE